MVVFAKIDVLAACMDYGPELQVPLGVAAAEAMEAIATVESSLGADCGPRQEPAYSTGGELAVGVQAELNLQYGDATAAASHGPWQMLFANFTPAAQGAIAAGTITLDRYALEFVRWFNLYVIGARGARTLAEIGEVWNEGHIAPDPEYVSKLEAAYAAA